MVHLNVIVSLLNKRKNGRRVYLTTRDSCGCLKDLDQNHKDNGEYEESDDAISDQAVGSHPSSHRLDGSHGSI